MEALGRAGVAPGPPRLQRVEQLRGLLKPAATSDAASAAGSRRLPPFARARGESLTSKSRRAAVLALAAVAVIGAWYLASKQTRPVLVRVVQAPCDAPGCHRDLLDATILFLNEVLNDASVRHASRLLVIAPEEALCAGLEGVDACREARKQSASAVRLVTSVAIRDGRLSMRIIAVEPDGHERLERSVSGPRARFLSLRRQLAQDLLRALEMEVDVAATPEPSHQQEVEEATLLLTRSLVGTLVSQRDPARIADASGGRTPFDTSWGPLGRSAFAAIADPELAQLLASYESGLEAEDPARVASLQPGITKAQLRTLRSYFDHVSNLDVQLSAVEVVMTDRSVLVTLTRTDRFNWTQTGHRLQLSLRGSVLLQRRQGGWTFQTQHVAPQEAEQQVEVQPSQAATTLPRPSANRPTSTIAPAEPSPTGLEGPSRPSSLRELPSSRTPVDERARDLLDRRKQLDLTTWDWTDLHLQLVVRSSDSIGGERLRELDAYGSRAPGVDTKTMLFFTSPPEVKGTGLLTFYHRDRPADFWLYLPELKRVRQITQRTSQERFVGAAFSYRDLELLYELVTWSESDATSRLRGQEEVDGVVTDAIEFTPKREDIGYGSIVLWIATDDLVARRVELYDEGHNLRKRVDLRDVRLVGSIPVPHRVDAVSPRDDMRTEITLTSVEVDRGLADDLFTQRALESGPPP